MLDFLAGGFLRGYRTYIFAWLAVATLLLQWGTGDATFAQLLHDLPGMLLAGGLGTLRSAVAAGGAK